MNKKLIDAKIKLAAMRAKNQHGVSESGEILGSGPLNRDGVPRLPPDQKEVKNWPVLDLGVLPEIKLTEWTLEMKGLCKKPGLLDSTSFEKLGIIEDTSDFHCVTGWSRFGLQWKGIRFSDLAKHVEVREEAKFVYVEGYDGYSTNLPLAEALKSDVLLVYEVDGKTLSKEHGGPVRMITPQLWAWKGAKWIKSIEFLENDRPGFWEVRGYSNSAIPWLNDRYTADELPEEFRKEKY